MSWSLARDIDGCSVTDREEVEAELGEAYRDDDALPIVPRSRPFRGVFLANDTLQLPITSPSDRACASCRSSLAMTSEEIESVSEPERCDRVRTILGDSAMIRLGRTSFLPILSSLAGVCTMGQMSSILRVCVHGF